MRLFTTAPFTRAPLLLRGHRGVVLAVFGTAIVLGLVASASPLFISSSGHASLHQEIEGRCASAVGGTLKNSQTFDLNEEAMAEALAEPEQLGGPVLTRIERPTEIAPLQQPERSLPVRFLSRTGFVSEIEIQDQDSAAEGVWLSDRATEFMGIQAGDHITVGVPGGSFETLVVAGVYGDIYFQPPSGFWCSNEQYFFPQPPTGELPVPLALVDRSLFDRLFVRAGSRSYSEVWEFPLATESLTIAQAETAVQDLIRLEERLRDDNRFAPLNFSNGGMDFIVRRTRALMEVLRTSIIPVAIAATLGALGLVGAAGSYWVDRRRRELMLLAAKGISPAALGIKAVLEMLLPAVTGLAVGWGVAVVVVPVFGPSALSDEAVRWGALQVTLVAGIAALALIGFVAGLRSRSLIEPSAHRARGLSLRAISIVVLVVGTFFAFFRLGDNAVAIAEGDAAGTVDPMVLVFPLLLFAAAVAVGAASILRLLPRLQRMGAGMAAAAYLAIRRITSSPALALVLVAASAFPVAILAYSAGLVRSVNATVEAKAVSFIGSDVSVAMPGDGEPPASLATRTTHVVRFSRQDAEGRDVDILGIDPSTFGRAVYWDDAFADRSVSDLLDLLNATGAGGPPPVIEANGTVNETSVLSSQWDEAMVRFSVVGEASAFPGMRSDRPLVIMERSALLAQLADGPSPAGLEHYWWVRGMSKAEVIESLNEAGVRFRFITQAQGVLDLAQFITVIRTFDFIQIVGVLAGIIATAGVLLYSDTRQRARNLAYALARRMGLTRPSHVRAGLLEIGMLLAVGLAIGLAAGILGSKLVYLRLDPIPRIPPAPLWRGTGPTIGASVLATAAVTWVAARIGQRAADRSDTSEVLPHGD